MKCCQEGISIASEQMRIGVPAGTQAPSGSANSIRHLPAAGRAGQIWTVDFLADARHYQELGVDSLLSNRPGFLRQDLFAASI
jgi:glycerophosphoryl diester phosphodiesterase